MNPAGEIVCRFLLPAFFLLFSFSAAAQFDSTSHYSSQQWDNTDGLPHVTVQSLLQTRDGYLWAGTLSGLTRFNGDSFTTFDNTNASVLANGRITALCQTRDNTIWIGSYSGDIHRLQNGLASQLVTNEVLRSAAVLDIFEAKDGTIWIGTIEGALRYRDKTLLRFSKSELLGHVSVKTFSEDSKHNIWMGTSAGLVCWSNNAAKLHPQLKGLPNEFVRAVCCDATDGVWYGTSSALMYFKNGETKHYSKKDGLADANITTLHEDKQGTLWVGTYGGLSRRTKDRFFIETTTERDPYDQVYAIKEDAEGNIWIGAKDGLYRLKQKQFATYTSQQGLAHNNVTSVRENQDGAIWFGTWGGGLHRLQNGKLSVYNWNSGASLGNDMILSMCETRDGTLWIGDDFDGGLFRFKNGQLSQIERKKFDDRAVRVLCEDHQGDLWIGTSTGLIRKHGDEFRKFSAEDGLSTGKIRSIEEDRDGRLWVGTEKGVFLWQEGHFLVPEPLRELSKVCVVEIFHDSSDALWFGTIGSGIYRLQGKSLANFTSQQGLPSDDIYEVLEDDENNYWFSCLKGVFCINKEQLSSALSKSGAKLSLVLYDKNDGMVSSQCNGSSKPAAWKSKDGRLWFATSKGLSVIDPNTVSFKGTHLPPAVFIEKVAGGKKDFLPDPVSKTTTPLEIEAGLSELEFRFSALSFRAPEKNRFRYRLQGFDPDWVDANPIHSVVYKGIRPGNYRFQVIAADSDGIWNQTGASVAVVLLPHFWQTWWFIGMSVGLGVMALAGAVRYVSTKNLQRQLDSLERQNAIQRERTRIAQDMHDDLGARLTEILFLSDVVADGKRKTEETRGHVKRISSAARELVRNLDVIVWALNPKNDVLDSFALYVYEYVETFLAPTGIRCRLDVPDELPNLVLSSEIRHNLFLVIKEALNNVAKHSCASEVWFRLRFDKNLLSISIDDSGKGFLEEKTTALGNGLVNMEKRMQTIGGCFELKTERGQGTQIRLLISIRKQ
jgi:ligand-binding sensor domain-containing protein/signal transduction histidine kinase